LGILNVQGVLNLYQLAHKVQKPKYR